MELAIRQENQAAGTIQNLLGQLGLNASLAGRGHYQVLYLREGQHLADYLILAGAHQSLLTFESLRVEKEMRNMSTASSTATTPTCSVWPTPPRGSLSSIAPCRPGDWNNSCPRMFWPPLRSASKTRI